MVCYLTQKKHGDVVERSNEKIFNKKKIQSIQKIYWITI